MAFLINHIKRIGCLAIVTALVVLVAVPRTSCAKQLAGGEYEVKAGFVYNFAKFVEWPVAAFDNNSSELVLCVIPDIPATDVFLSLNNMPVGGRKFKVIKANDASRLAGSQIVFIASSKPEDVDRLLKAVADKPVLTIGETDGFTGSGGIIHF
ncbi:MAG: YfiR family protein, partial [Deltaproteobacteria bacterium]|nr:YfiR family protein [Deltaproteobacteria bacterium]